MFDEESNENLLIKEPENESEPKCSQKIPQNKIKHLVISGGSVWGLYAFGAIFEAVTVGFLNIKDLKSMYLTSVGSIIGIMYSLGISETILKDYFIKRPWETVCKKSRCSVLEIYDNKGVIQNTFFENMFSPLLKSVDLTVDSTMMDLFLFNGIEIHIYTTELNSFQLVDISYKTHPDWRIVDAIHCSCSIPFIFSPMIKDGQCFLDGAFMLNYPIKKCIENVGNNINEILSISLGNKAPGSPSTIQLVDEQSNIFDLFQLLLHHLTDFYSKHIKKENVLLENSNSVGGEKCVKNINIPFEILFFSSLPTLEYCLNILYSKDERKSLIYNGINEMKKYLRIWFSDNQTE